MNILKLKTLATLAVFAPSVVFAQIAIPAVTSSDVSETDARAENTGVEEPDFGVTATGLGGATGIEKEDLGVVRDDNGGLSKGNVETGFKVEEGESDVVTGAFLDDDNDGDGVDTEEIEFTLSPDRIEASLQERLDDDSDGDGLVDESDDEEFQVDSFFDVFTNLSNDEAKSAVDAFLKLDDIAGESKDDDAVDDDTDDIRLAKKLTEIVIDGSTVRQKVEENEVEVRGWDPEKKEVTIKPEDVHKGEDFLDFVGAVIIGDENIENVSLNYGEIKMEYIQPAKLFGFIPMNLTAQVELSEKDEVKVSFPWYTFFTKNNAKKVKDDIDVLSLSWGAEKGGKDTDLQDRASKFQNISNVMKKAHDVSILNLL